ncbi:nuclear transport factor 2 family protein [Streptomyces sp. DSM 15324]|uniref:nuclear transport factor 2 family protein n=1 Tax=Streptomyces sp. DSM 15324 TaxID=1739111 RepID=UPI00074685F3|nr:nuclear transport factor 2 family protein [Streptomyces sp. DSM 15324]KUO07292.1 ketosteroid isomerase [Streptomyces sp. DSM 15324]
MTTIHDVVTEIRKLEDIRYQALVDSDWDRFARLCHPELAYTHATGDTDTLDSYLEKVRAGFFVYHRIDHPLDFIRVVDDVALVVGGMNAHVTAGGKDRTLRNKSLAVWKHTTDGWRLLAYQPTPVAG